MVEVRAKRASKPRLLTAALTVLLLTSLAPPASAKDVETRPSYAAPRLAPGHNAWVSVSVARLWLSPGSPRPVDRPALAQPVRFTQWLHALSLSQRRGLYYLTPTEALLGDRVVVLQLRPHWAKVVVPSQPSQKHRRGYPGWVPRNQLTTQRPPVTDEEATVIRRTAWLRTDETAATHVMPISIGTRLHVMGRIGRYVQVVTPLGATRRILQGSVVLHPWGTPALKPSRAGIVATAKSFLGLPYLWGGLSGFGLDCSGLTWIDYRLHGIRIPRDALPQSKHGRRPHPRRAGDLLFYGSPVHHVTMYLGHNQMIQAQGTGTRVKIDPTSFPPLASEYAGARRYLP
ncbi:C40 family peptidase [Nocardioides humilatus]|uniref:C40 family peptidase n=1 Tax=Nocardioides humilatus TaxID=2607660 RepID=UPI00165F1764|nr:C40 family peptidase [Nocardioides humilatus]